MKLLIKPTAHKGVNEVCITEHKLARKAPKRVGYCGDSWEAGYSFIVQHGLKAHERDEVARLLKAYYESCNAGGNPGDERQAS